MAIQFARAEFASRSSGKNACCKAAYNARSRIIDEKTNVTYDFSKKGDNVHHEMILPDHVDKKFKNPSVLANEVERTEKKINSQLYKEYVLALPDEANVTFEMKIEMVHKFIKENKFIEENLGVQFDMYEPHDDEKNWHAHLLVTTRRFNELGTELEEKVRDLQLQPQVRGGRISTHVLSKDETNLDVLWTQI